jgi:hypothetical protein
MGLGTAAVKYAERADTGMLARTDAGRKFNPMLTGKRRVKFPE